jgi:hypothetical protein
MICSECREAGRKLEYAKSGKPANINVVLATVKVLHSRCSDKESCTCQHKTDLQAVNGGK